MDMLQYKIWLLEEDDADCIGEPGAPATTFECSAFSEWGALEKANVRYPNCTIISCERMEYPSPY